MRRFLCILLSLILVLSLFSGCSGDSPETVPPSSGTPDVPETTAVPTVEPTVPPETQDPALEALRQNLPVMDGSTSLIPLEAGIRAALFGKSLEEATKDVSHTSSWSAFYKLIEGRADLIFSVPLSDDQKQLGESSGVAPIAVPIAKEGFVFVVNADNPVNSLTQQQLRDIYSGRITNWSEVGGLDEEIIPYQRNWDSGSQNYMREFMGTTPLMDAPSELRPASMSGLMDVIAVNDNSRAAIGYSVYAYAADMYGNGDEIKFIQVDGVAPSKATFADGTYPLMGYNYAIYRAEDRQGTYVSQLVDWLLSPEGQTAIANAGYVTVTDIGYDYTEKTLEKYQGIGLGLPAGETPSSEFVAIGTARTYGGDPFPIDGIAPVAATLPDGTKTYRIDCLADKALQQEVNDWIDQQMVWVAEEQPELEALLASLNRDYEDYDLYVYGLGIGQYSMPEGMPAACFIDIRNGYLSVAVSLCYTEQVMYGYARYQHTETAVWDLVEGRRLAPEELFCQGVDIDQVLNDYIRVKSQTEDVEFGDPPQLLEDFVSLPPDGWHLTHDAIYIDSGGDTFAYGCKFDLDGLPDGILVTDQLRDFSHCIESGEVQAVRQFRSLNRDLYYAYNADELVSCGFLKEDASPHAAAINAQVMDHLNTYFTREAIEGYFAGLGHDTATLDLWMMDWYTNNWGGRYLVFQGYTPELYLEGSHQFVPYPVKKLFIFDLESGQELQWQDLLIDGWQEEVPLLSTHDGNPTGNPGFDTLTINSMYASGSEGLVLCYFEEDCYLQIPYRFLRFD